MTLLRAAAWRKHPLFQLKPQHVLMGLPTGVAMFVAVKAGEKAGVIDFSDKTDPKKYEFVSSVYGAPPKEHH